MDVAKIPASSTVVGIIVEVESARAAGVIAVLLVVGIVAEVLVMAIVVVSDLAGAVVVLTVRFPEQGWKVHND